MLTRFLSLILQSASLAQFCLICCCGRGRRWWQRGAKIGNRGQQIGTPAGAVMPGDAFFDGSEDGGKRATADHERGLVVAADRRVPDQVADLAGHLAAQSIGRGRLWRLAPVRAGRAIC